MFVCVYDRPITKTKNEEDSHTNGIHFSCKSQEKKWVVSKCECKTTTQNGTFQQPNKMDHHHYDFYLWRKKNKTKQCNSKMRKWGKWKLTRFVFLFINGIFQCCHSKHTHTHIKRENLANTSSEFCVSSLRFSFVFFTIFVYYVNHYQHYYQTRKSNPFRILQ